MKKIIILVLASLLILGMQCVIQPAVAGDTVVFDFFYGSYCNSCKQKFPIIREIENNTNYQGLVTFTWKDRDTSEAVQQEYEATYEPIFREQHSFPLTFVVIKNETNTTLIYTDNFNVPYISSVLDQYIATVDLPVDAPPSTGVGYEIIMIAAVIVTFSFIALIVILQKKKK